MHSRHVIGTIARENTFSGRKHHAHAACLPKVVAVTHIAANCKRRGIDSRHVARKKTVVHALKLVKASSNVAAALTVNKGGVFEVSRRCAFNVEIIAALEVLADVADGFCTIANALMAEELVVGGGKPFCLLRRTN